MVIDYVGFVAGFGWFDENILHLESFGGAA